MSYIPQDIFSIIVEHTPLVSIDLLVQDSSSAAYLFGERVNRPAQGYWFVPGGRVQKNESIANAFRRLTKTELGVELHIQQAAFKGVYQHFYSDSALCDSSSTHYIVLAFLIESNLIDRELPKQQHNVYRWILPNEVLADENVHPYCKDYFDPSKGYC